LSPPFKLSLRPLQFDRESWFALLAISIYCGRLLKALKKESESTPYILQTFLDNISLFLLGGCSTFLLIMWVMCLDGSRFTELMNQNGSMFIDFCKVYGLSKMVYAGLGFAVYDPVAQKIFLHDLIPAHSFAAFAFLPYPPFVYALFGVFSALSLVPAYGAWTAFTLLVGLCCISYLRLQVSKKDTSTQKLLLLTLFMCSVFNFNNFFLGQAAWLMTGLTCLFFAALMRRNDTICGVTLGLCSIKFQFLLLLAAPLLVLKRWRALYIGIVIVLLFLVVAVGSIGIKNVLNYPNILNVQEILHPNIPMMINLRGFLFTISPGTDHLNAVLSGIFALLAIFGVWSSARTSAQQRLAIPISTILYLVFSPHVFVYDGLLLAVPTAINLKPMSLMSVFGPHRWNLKLRALLLCAFPIIGWLAYLGGNACLGRVLLCFNLLLLFFSLVEYFDYFAVLKRSSWIAR
jgi:Glycosyltransferase family 87